MTKLAQEALVPGAYPRTYRLSPGSKWLVSILGAVLISLGAVFSYLANGNDAPAGSAVLLAVSGAFALLGIYLLAAALFYRVTLQADSIEVFEIYRRRRLLRDDIEGRSHFSNAQAPAGWVLVPKAGFGGKIQLSRFLETDKDFLSWIRSLPDLDLGKKRAVEQERAAAIAALEQRGFSQARIKRLRDAARALNWVVFVLGFTSFFLFDPPHFLIWVLVALPWVGILLVGHFAPYYRFGGPKKSPQPDLSLVLISPGAFLTLNALRAMSPIGWERPLILTVLGSTVLVGIAFWRDPWLKKHLGVTALVLMLCCGYGYGAGMEMNALLDRSKPEKYQVAVNGKHASHGKSTSYHLQLAPWGPNTQGQDLTVSYSQYAATKPGDMVCMLLRPGALGVAWSELARCEGSY